MSANGKSGSVEADLVLHTAGRAPALAELDLKAAGVEVSKGRLCLNDYLQSTSNLVGPHADDVINLFALAIRHGLTAEDLKTTMFSYPTGASDIAYTL